MVRTRKQTLANRPSRKQQKKKRVQTYQANPGNISSPNPPILPITLLTNTNLPPPPSLSNPQTPLNNLTGPTAFATKSYVNSPSTSSKSKTSLNPDDAPALATTTSSRVMLCSAASRAARVSDAMLGLASSRRRGRKDEVGEEGGKGVGKGEREVPITVVCGRRRRWEMRAWPMPGGLVCE